MRCNSFNTQPPEGGCRGQAGLIIRMMEFQHTAARRRLHDQLSAPLKGVMFQHTAARRRLPTLLQGITVFCQFQHTAARRRLPKLGEEIHDNISVSTHSRPKAAA